MSTEAIALSCFIVLVILFAGYLFTAYEFKVMSEHPDQFTDEEDKDRINVNR